MNRPFHSSPITKENERYYLGIWTWNFDNQLDYFACAWREGGQWSARVRFQYCTLRPHERRYHHSLDVKTDSEASQRMAEGSKLSRVGHESPIHYYPINGNAEKVSEMLLSDKNLIAAAMTPPEMPALYDAEASAAGKILLQGKKKEYFEFIQRHAKPDQAVPNAISLWPLEIQLIVGDGPTTPNW